ncbi:unnamed protein product [Amoebophrya sp. A120]|nr:unnamed protein product [Amoebophrya sp. A120]|eukprot:GSA120T00021530001.1
MWHNPECVLVPVANATSVADLHDLVATGDVDCALLVALLRRFLRPFVANATLSEADLEAQTTLLLTACQAGGSPSIADVLDGVNDLIAPPLLDLDGLRDQVGNRTRTCDHIVLSAQALLQPFVDDYFTLEQSEADALVARLRTACEGGDDGDMGDVIDDIADVVDVIAQAPPSFGPRPDEVVFKKTLDLNETGQNTSSSTRSLAEEEASCDPCCLLWLLLLLLLLLLIGLYVLRKLCLAGDETSTGAATISREEEQSATSPLLRDRRGSNDRAGQLHEKSPVEFAGAVVEKGFLSAGLSGEYARRLADQVEDEKVDDEALLLRPTDPHDMEIMQRMGLDFDDVEAPEQVGRMRGFLKNVYRKQHEDHLLEVQAETRSSGAEALVAAEDQDDLVEAKMRLMEEGFSAHLAGYLAARLLQKVKDDVGPDHQGPAINHDQDEAQTVHVSLEDLQNWDWEQHAEPEDREKVNQMIQNAVADAFEVNFVPFDQHHHYGEQRASQTQRRKTEDELDFHLMRENLPGYETARELHGFARMRPPKMKRQVDVEPSREKSAGTRPSAQNKDSVASSGGSSSSVQSATSAVSEVEQSDQSDLDSETGASVASSTSSKGPKGPKKKRWVKTGKTKTRTVKRIITHKHIVHHHDHHKEVESADHDDHDAHPHEPEVNVEGDNNIVHGSASGPPGGGTSINSTSSLPEGIDSTFCPPEILAELSEAEKTLLQDAERALVLCGFEKAHANHLAKKMGAVPVEWHSPETITLTVYERKVLSKNLPHAATCTNLEDLAHELVEQNAEIFAPYRAPDSALVSQAEQLHDQSHRSFLFAKIAGLPASTNATKILSSASAGPDSHHKLLAQKEKAKKKQHGSTSTSGKNKKTGEAGAEADSTTTTTKTKVKTTSTSIKGHKKHEGEAGGTSSSKKKHKQQDHEHD